MIGFAIYSFFRTLFLESDKKKKKKKILLSFVPLIISVLVVLSVKLAYEIQEYGLIKEVNRDKTDMSRINVTCDLNLSDKKEKVPVFIADNVSISENIYSKNIKELYCNLGSSQREAIDNENEYRTKSVDGKYSINFDKKYLSYKIIFEEMNEQKEGETIVYNGENKTLTWKSEVYIDSVCNQVTDINMNDEKVRKLTNMYYEKYVKNINFIHNEGNVKILMKDMYIEYKFDNIKDDCNFSTVFIYLNNDYSIDNIEINNSLIKKYKSEEIISEKDVLDIINSGKVGLRSFNGIVDVKNISISYLVDSKEYFRPVYEVLYLYGDETQFKKIYIDAIKK